MVSQDIAGLMDLWAADAVLADAKHTPDDPNDDARRKGRYAIRERYVVLVFPGNPTSAGAMDVQLDIRGDQATVVEHHRHRQRSRAGRRSLDLCETGRAMVDHGADV